MKITATFKSALAGVIAAGVLVPAASFAADSQQANPVEPLGQVDQGPSSSPTTTPSPTPVDKADDDKSPVDGVESDADAAALSAEDEADASRALDEFEQALDAGELDIDVDTDVHTEFDVDEFFDAEEYEYDECEQASWRYIDLIEDALWLRISFSRGVADELSIAYQENDIHYVETQAPLYGSQWHTETLLHVQFTKLTDEEHQTVWEIDDRRGYGFVLPYDLVDAFIDAEAGLCEDVELDAVQQRAADQMAEQAEYVPYVHGENNPCPFFAHQTRWDVATPMTYGECLGAWQEGMGLAAAEGPYWLEIEYTICETGETSGEQSIDGEPISFESCTFDEVGYQEALAHAEEEGWGEDC